MELPKSNSSPANIERAERLRAVIEYLNEINEHIPIIVEGKRDASALKKLGISGEIIKLHNGKNLYDFCDDISQKFPQVILLLDWDQTGDDLFKTITNYLKGQFEEFSSFRELLRILCQKDINDIEGIPKLLKRLEGDVFTW
jgi:5S rRNA maturation endonuclease (ribonuclease M5)